MYMYEYHLVNKTSTSPSHCFVRTRTTAPDMPRSSDLLVGELSNEIYVPDMKIDGVMIPSSIIRTRAWFFFYEDTHRVFIKGKAFAKIFLKTKLNWSLQECKHCLVKDAFTKFGELHKCPAPSSTPPPRKYGRTEEDQRFFGMMLGNHIL